MASVLRRSGERAVAFVEVNRLADERDAEMLLPFAVGKFAARLDRLVQRFNPLRFFFHAFDQDAAIEFLRRLKTKKMKNR